MAVCVVFIRALCRRELHWLFRLNRLLESCGPSIDALRPVPGRARNGTVGYQNETLKRQAGSGSALPCSDNARNAARSVSTAANAPSTELGTPPCFRSRRLGGPHDGDFEGARMM